LGGLATFHELGCWRYLDHGVNGVRIVAIVIVPPLPTVFKDGEKILVRVAISARPLSMP
jgi:hypothetical protein